MRSLPDAEGAQERGVDPARGGKSAVVLIRANRRATARTDVAVDRAAIIAAAAEFALYIHREAVGIRPVNRLPAIHGGRAAVVGKAHARARIIIRRTPVVRRRAVAVTIAKRRPDNDIRAVPVVVVVIMPVVFVTVVFVVFVVLVFGLDGDRRE